MKKTEFVYLAVLLLLTFAVFWVNAMVGGSVASPRHLAKDLVSPPDSPQDWNVQEHIPAKYRLLFKWVVRGTWSTIFPESGAEGFYRVYIFWSVLFFYATFVSFYFFLRVLEFSRSSSFIGCLLLISSPPVALAYRFPVHTREDPLAYLLVVLGMIAIFKLKPVLVGLISIAGALTRETTLIVPLVYLLAVADSFRRKLMVFIPPVFIVAMLWLCMGKSYTYNPLAVRTVRYPLETASFIFMVFGFLWLPGLIRLFSMRRQRDALSYPWKVLVSTAPIALLLIVGVHLSLARAREIRISFLFFPWLIPLALDWFRINIHRIRALATNHLYWCWVIFIVVFLTGASAYIRLNCPRFMWYFRAFQSRTWLNLAYAHLLITLVFILPICVNLPGSSRKV